MGLKRIIPCLFLKDKKAVKWFDDETVVAENVLDLVKTYNENGADELLIFNLTDNEDDKDEAVHFLKKIKKNLFIPMIVAGSIDNLEDVKKVLYAGANRVVVNMAKPNADKLIEDAATRFGKEKVAVSINDFDTMFKHQRLINEFAKDVLLLHQMDLNSVTNVSESELVVFTKLEDMDVVLSFLENEKVRGVVGPVFSSADAKLTKIKDICVERGIEVSSFEANIEFSEFKTDDQGLVPVVVQNYRTQEVLMVAYMNEEAYYKTIKTGKMTYYSRSRQELWVKGETSGHTQYLKSLDIDCDKDTLLAKVDQVGPACHTGSPTCFYTRISGEAEATSNPLYVFKHLYDVIVDRRENPKEGSYTNYLFDKGIDKILKKVGEEASEIIIASKNPSTEEIKYEIADFLYHMTVLMVEKGISWDEVINELDDR